MLAPSQERAQGAGRAGMASAAAALLATVIEAASEHSGSPRSRLEGFLEAQWPQSLVEWLGAERARLLAADKQALLQGLDRDIARLDALLSGQVNVILHHSRFQRLEASWRGLRYLCEQAVEAANVKIRVLDVSWKTLGRDLERAIEFDQSQFFNKVYSEEFGAPGGEPFGVLIGDYEVCHRPLGPEHPDDDMTVLRGIAQVAAAAFAPFIAAAHPATFGLNGFCDLGLTADISAVFQQQEYMSWNSFRSSNEDSRFIGLTLPRVLMRRPHEDDGSRQDGFHFREDVTGPDNSRYLWGNAAYAFAAVLIRAFAAHGWLADIRGVRKGQFAGGLVTGLPVHSFGTDREGLAPKGSTEVMITDAQDKELAELGFIPLCHCWDTEWSAFYSTPSVQRPRSYDRSVATINARLSAMLQYMLCVSRFGHYLKVIGRDKLASFSSPADCERYLQRWVLDYVTADDTASLETKAKFPLREASVQVREQPGKPGDYVCIVHLRPHFQLEQAVSTVRLVTELTMGAPR